MLFTQDQRLVHANRLIDIIAAHGRRFFFYAPLSRTAHFSCDEAGRVWFQDAFTGKQVKILPGREGHRPDGFTSGSTLLNLVEQLAHYVLDERLLHPELIAPAGYSWGDLWAYGEAAVVVREEAFALPMFEQTTTTVGSP